MYCTILFMLKEEMAENMLQISGPTEPIIKAQDNLRRSKYNGKKELQGRVNGRRETVATEERGGRREANWRLLARGDMLR